MAAAKESAMADLVDRFVADGNWAMAISTANMVLREYESGMASDPQRYASLVEQAKAQIAHLTAQAEAAGAPTTLQPSAYARALVAAANPDPTPDDEAVIAQAKAEASESGMRRYVDETLAGIAAAAEPPRTPEDHQAQALCREFQQLIERERRRARRIERTTSEAVVTAAVLPLSPDRNLARRFAWQSALLRRFGRDKEAVTAALEACARYSVLPYLDETEEGYYAYNLLLLAEDFLDRSDGEYASRPASTAAALFAKHRDELDPHGLPDLVRAALILARCYADLGMVEAATRLLLEARQVAESLDESYGGPFGEPGAMPPGWGLPAVPTARQWRTVRRQLAKTAKRLRV